MVRPRFAKTENQVVGELVSLDLELVMIKKFDCLYSVALQKLILYITNFFWMTLYTETII